jgi:cellulose synthase/poly-beta-1,6-N-acetylglucosamine synthase-like glycosyltransferase
MTPFLVILAVLVGLPGAATALHLGLLAVAAIFFRTPSPPAEVPPVRFIVLVPAHNEEKVIGATLAALMTDRRADDTVLVVADRCNDATAALARAAGAQVLERGPGDEPGRAAARQDGVQHALGLPWDAMVMIDADSIIEPGFFDACEAAMASGAEALQARSEAAIGNRLIDQAALASFALQGVLMPRGRDRLGLLVRLRGTGMVMARRLVTEYRFRAPASEDLWFSLDLCLDGIRPRHVENARLRSVTCDTWHDAGVQRVRYEAGRMSAAQEFFKPLVRRHSPASIEAAWFLATPPFAIAVLSLVVATALAALSGVAAIAWTFAALTGLLAFVLGVGLVQAGASRRTWLALAVAPWYVPWKAVMQLRALISVRRRVNVYAPTPR